MDENSNKKTRKLNNDSFIICVFSMSYFTAYPYTIGSEIPLIFW